MKIDTKPIYTFTYHQYANNNFTFALLEGDRYLHTPYMCKDYLQDIFWSEYTGESGTACGLTWKQGMIKLAPRMRLAVHGGQQEMASRSANLQAFLNQFDTAQGFDPTTVHTTDDPNLIVVEFSEGWTTSGPMISAFSSLIRVAGMWAPPEPIVDYLKRMARPVFDKNFQKQWDPEFPYMTVEVQRLMADPKRPKTGTLHKLFAILKGEKYKGKWADQENMNIAHGYGIMMEPKFPMVAL